MDARIDQVHRAAARRPGMLLLSGGLPHESLFPRAELARAFLSVVAQPKCPALQYGWPEGDDELRAWIAGRLCRRGANVSAGDVVVTNGAQQGIAIAVDFLRGVGRRAGVDRETYPAALDLFASRGCRATDSGEVDWSYTMPGIANPGGRAMTAEQRRALLASGRPIIADEAYAELRFDGVAPRPLIADARDRVWHVGTFSKVLCPGLRVGWLVPPPGALEEVVRAKHERDLQAGTLAQAVVRTFLDGDSFDGRLAHARAFYEQRAERLSRALRRRVPGWRFSEPEGGFSLFVETDLAGDDVAFLERAARHGVTFDPGSIFRARPSSGPIALRLCHSSVPTLPDLDEAVVRLETAARELARPGVLRSVAPRTRPLDAQTRPVPASR